VAVAAGALDVIDDDVLGGQVHRPGDFAPEEVDALGVRPDLQAVVGRLRDGARRADRSVRDERTVVGRRARLRHNWFGGDRALGEHRCLRWRTNEEPGQVVLVG